MRKLVLILLAGLLVGAPRMALAQAAPSGPTTVILVRHAEKDVQPDGDPILTAAGTARAEALAQLLADRGVGAIIVTEYARTQLTAEPLARRLGITPTILPARAGLREHAMAIADLVHGEYAGKTVLVVGHSNTLPAIVVALGGHPIDAICDGSFSNLYVVTIQPSQHVDVDHRTYGAPDAANACEGQN
jgi:broad specificity phosphatase PhoE